MPNTYTLKAIKEFTCIGADCESNCCKRERQVEIEPETLARWNQLGDVSLKKRLLSHVNNNLINGLNIASIAFNKNNICHHLNNEDKCCIQTELGPEYQPRTCKEYPREYFQSKTVSINSANMSCPEIARLVIENTEYDIFTTGDITNADLSTVGDGNNALENYLDQWVRLVLQDKDSPISLKLYYIGKVISDFNAFSEKGGLDEKTVTEICGSYQDHLKSLIEAYNGNELKADPVSAGWFWDVNYTFSKETYNDLSSYYQLVDHIAPLELPTKKRSQEDYKSVYAEVNKILSDVRPLISELQPELLTYLKTLFINMGFPWNPIGGNLLASYIKSVFHFTSTWYLLALIAQSKGSLDTHDLARVIYHVERNYFDSHKLSSTMKNNPALFNVENYLSSLLDLKS